MMNPWTLLAGLLFVIAAYFGGQHQGKKIERAEWQKEKIALQEKAIADVQAEVDKRTRTQKFHQDLARKASESYEKDLAARDTAHAAEVAAIKRSGGLRIPATACRASAQVAGTAQTPGAGGPDEASAASIELPERTQERLYALVERAGKLAIQLDSLQKWIRVEGFYGDGIPHP